MIPLGDAAAQIERCNAENEQAMSYEGTQLLYRGEWFTVRGGPFEIVPALDASAPDDLLVFTEADTGRTLWLRAGQVDAIVSGGVREPDLREDDGLLDRAFEELSRSAPYRQGCERRAQRLPSPRQRGDC